MKLWCAIIQLYKRRQCFLSYEMVWWWWRINWKQRRWPILYNGALISLRLASTKEVTMCHGVAAWWLIKELMMILITHFSCYHILCKSYTLNQMLTGRTTTPNQTTSVDVIQTSLRSAIFETSWETELWMLTPCEKSKFDLNISAVANKNISHKIPLF